MANDEAGKRGEIARRILAGGPPKTDSARHFDGCPARDGKLVCTCGGYRASPTAHGAPTEARVGSGREAAEVRDIRSAVMIYYATRNATSDPESLGMMRCKSLLEALDKAEFEWNEANRVSGNWAQMYATARDQVTGLTAALREIATDEDGMLGAPGCGHPDVAQKALDALAKLDGGPT